MRTLFLTLITCLFVLPAYAKYSGGTGGPNDPYQIATAADLIALGETPDDYDKHFILTADIDLDPSLPGRKVFYGPVIRSLTGVFDGNGHTISHLTITGQSFVGLFGTLSGEVRNLGVVSVSVVGSGNYIGGLVGWNDGTVTHCHSTGAVTGYEVVGGLMGYTFGIVRDSYTATSVSGTYDVGGLVGRNAGGIVIQCYSTGRVSGTGSRVGGLVGCHNTGSVILCYSTGTVSGIGESSGAVGGLVGLNLAGSVTQCYSTGVVSGEWEVGGLVGDNSGGFVTQCYSTGAVRGGNGVGGLVGSGWSGGITACFWDTQTSGQTTSAGGTGKTTSEMKDIRTYLDAGWDLVGEIENGTHEAWQMPEGGGYPVLAIFEGYIPHELRGIGTTEEPYLISNVAELGAMVHYSPHAHFRLAAPIDLSGIRWGTSVIPWLSGTFDGNNLTISHLSIRAGKDIGLFGGVRSGAQVRDLGIVDVNVTGSGDYVGGIAGFNDGSVTHCHSTGLVSGHSSVGGLLGGNAGTVTECHSAVVVTGIGSGPWEGGYRGVGGLVGSNYGPLTQCYSTGAVNGTDYYVGGLVGYNDHYAESVTQCYSTAVVSGNNCVGGLVGGNHVSLTNCYSTGAVSGTKYVGGLVGGNAGTVTNCYSIGRVRGTSSFGGLVGSNNYYWGTEGVVSDSFWNIWTSRQTTSASGTGKTTAEMQTASTFISAGWDFVDETANGTEDVWWINEGQDYPKLWWESRVPGPSAWEGSGTPDDPYQIVTLKDLMLLGESPGNYDKHFILMADIDLDPNLAGRWVFSEAVIAWDTDVIASGFQAPPFSGVFDGNGHTISHLKIVGGNYLGLFGHLSGEVRNLGIVDVNITSSGSHVGALVGYNRYHASVTHCYSTGTVIASEYVGGLVGRNDGEVTRCYSTAAIEGGGTVGGLVGQNSGDVTDSCSGGTVGGMEGVGGLVGYNDNGTVIHCYSTGAVSGISFVGGLAGINLGTVNQCYSTGLTRGDRLFGGLVGTGSSSAVTASFWDTQTSGQTSSAGGTGKTTPEMQTAKTFLDAGWDFIGETANGTKDLWWILEGKDYPRLWWETK